MKNYLISIGGNSTSNVLSIESNFEEIIAVDSGVEHLFKLSLDPTTLIGDLDSINLNQMLSGNFNFFFLLVPFAATFYTTLLIYKEINGLEIKALITSRKKIDFNRIFFGFLVASILIILNIQDYDFSLQKIHH